jgi:hypothetical protein
MSRYARAAIFSDACSRFKSSLVGMHVSQVPVCCACVRACVRACVIALRYACVTVAASVFACVFVCERV